MESDTLLTQQLIRSTLARLADSPLIRTAVVYIPGEKYRTYLQKTVMMNSSTVIIVFVYYKFFSDFCGK